MLGLKKILSGIVCGLLGAAGGTIVTAKTIGKSTYEYQQMSDKHLALFLLMNRWVRVKQEGKSLEDYFVKNNYNNIAIYGMSYVGTTLAEELKNSSVCIDYGIDKHNESLVADFPVVHPEEDLVAVDAVVVTPITYYEAIKNELNKKMNCPIISIEDILDEL